MTKRERAIAAVREHGWTEEAVQVIRPAGLNNA